MPLSSGPASDQDESGGLSSEASKLGLYFTWLKISSCVTTFSHFGISACLFYMSFIDGDETSEWIVMCFVASVATLIWALVGTYEVFDGIHGMQTKNLEMDHRYNWHQTQYMLAVYVAFMLVFISCPAVHLYISNSIAMQNPLCDHSFFKLLVILPNSDSTSDDCSFDPRLDPTKEDSATQTCKLTKKGTWDSTSVNPGGWSEDSRNGYAFNLLIVHTLISILLFIVSLCNVIWSTWQLREWQAQSKAKAESEEKDGDDSSDDEDESVLTHSPCVKCLTFSKYFMDVVAFLYCVVLCGFVNNSGIYTFTIIELVFILSFGYQIFKLTREKYVGADLEDWEYTWRDTSSMHLFLMYMCIWAILTIAVAWYYGVNSIWCLANDLPVLYFFMIFFLIMIVAYAHFLYLNSRCLNELDEESSRNFVGTTAKISHRASIQVDPSSVHASSRKSSQMTVVLEMPHRVTLESKSRSSKSHDGSMINI